MPLAYYSVAASQAFWSEHWGGHSPSELLEIAQTSPLTDLIERALPRRGLILEAGCGLGQYVVLLRGRGHRILGADWSVDALARCRSDFPKTPVAAMDLRRLALRPASIQACLSLGVVEHDPAGPDALVAEAARVLAPGGVLILSVPYLNGVRRLAKPYLGWRARRLRSSGGEFYQFAFARAEVRAFLHAHGFRVQALHPYDPARVLRTALRAIVRRRPARRGSVVAERARPVTERSATRPTGLERFIRRALYTDPALAMFGHMILAVAVKR